MSLRFPPVLPSWQYGDPSETVSVSAATPDLAPVAAVALRQPRDRYYTQARRLHVKHLVKIIRGNG